MTNSTLNKAKANKKDEFYTLLEDVKRELIHYTRHFEDKVIYLNCDNPHYSNFWTYFYKNFSLLGIKKLIATYYSEESYKWEYNGKSVTKTKLKGDGDFKSPECIDILKDVDIVVTNPPFSLFRDFISLMVESGKSFIVWGNQNALGHTELFPLINNNEVWTGYIANKTCAFQVPLDYENGKIVEGKKYIQVPSITTFTNLDIEKEHVDIKLTKTYNEEDYPMYDNYDIIEVGRVNNIPKDYYGIMGVPITFIHKHNPEQFEILGSHRWEKDEDVIKSYKGSREECLKDKKTTINGKETYSRIFIRRKR